MMRFAALLLAMLLLCGACEDGAGPISNGDGTSPTKDDTVAANCEVVAGALEAYAAENNGDYPRSLDQESLSGNTVFDLLPGGQMPVDPYSGQPGDLEECGNPTPGNILYYPVVTNPWGASSPVANFRVTGYGANGDVVTELTHDPSDSLLLRDDSVVQNCETVRDAVEAFASMNDGWYPGGLWDTTPGGDTVIDLLPSGTLLDNPYTGVPTEPTNGTAALFGQTGYLVQVDTLGRNAGYTITGYGWCGEIVNISVMHQVTTSPGPES
jgi:hypothetical protein